MPSSSLSSHAMSRPFLNFTFYSFAAHSFRLSYIKPYFLIHGVNWQLWGVSIWADLWGGVSVHGIIYDLYYVIMNTAMMTMNTDHVDHEH